MNKTMLFTNKLYTQYNNIATIRDFSDEVVYVYAHTFYESSYLFDLPYEAELLITEAIK